jgi:hypothetical protein
MAPATSVETAKAGVSLEGVGPSNPAMVESTEGAGMHSRGDMRAVESMGNSSSAEAPAMRIGGAVEVSSTRTKIVTVDDRSAMRDESVVVVNYSPAALPIVSPTMPTPVEADKYPDPET